MFGVVVDVQHHNGSAIRFDLLSKLERHIYFLHVGFVFHGTNEVIPNVECESELVSLEEIHVPIVDKRYLAELFFIEVLLVDVDLKGERLVEDGFVGRLLGHVVR